MAPITSLSVTVPGRDLPDVPARCVASGLVWLHGEHDLSTVAVLSAALTQAIALDDADVEVDMTEVQFLDAAIVSVLLRARELLRARSRRLVLRSPPRCVRRVLELCGAEDLLAFAPLSAGPIPALVSSVVVGHREDELTTAVAGRGAP